MLHSTLPLFLHPLFTSLLRYYYLFINWLIHFDFVDFILLLLMPLARPCRPDHHLFIIVVYLGLILRPQMSRFACQIILLWRRLIGFLALAFCYYRLNWDHRLEEAVLRMVVNLDRRIACSPLLRTRTWCKHAR